MAVPEGFLQLAEDAGRALAGQGWRLVYGGGSVGMMGRCADGALAAGGEVVGVITGALVGMEVAHAGLTRLDVVATMHERKQRMTDASDAFLILPGGFGTLDETFEAITWKQLGVHAKPIVVLNHDGFFDHLLAFLAAAAEARFIRPAHLRLITTVATLDQAMAELESAPAWEGTRDKWWFESAPRRP